MGQVPNTSTFKLSDVVAAMNSQDAVLSLLFGVAKAAGFDPLYEGNKDRLSNFRNYNHDVVLLYTEPAILYIAKAGGNYSFMLTGAFASLPFTSARPTWVTQTPQSGTMQYSIQINISASQNTTGQTRSGYVHIYTDEGNVSCGLIQAGGDEEDY